VSKTARCRLVREQEASVCTCIPFIWFCFPWFVQDILLVRCWRVIYVAEGIAPRSDSLTWLDLLLGGFWPHGLQLILGVTMGPTRLHLFSPCVFGPRARSAGASHDSLSIEQVLLFRAKFIDLIIYMMLCT